MQVLGKRRTCIPNDRTWKRRTKVLTTNLFYYGHRQKKSIFFVGILDFLGSFCYIYIIMGICSKIIFSQPSHYIKIPYQPRKSQPKKCKILVFFLTLLSEKNLLANKSNINIRGAANRQNLRQTGTEKAIERVDLEPQIGVLPKYCNPNLPKTS